MTEYYQTKCRSFTDYESLEELEDDLNKFFENKFIVSSPIMINYSKYNCMVYYKVSPLNIKDKVQEKESELPKASDKQIKYLIGLGYKGSTNINIQEAKHLINEYKDKRLNEKRN